MKRRNFIKALTAAFITPTINEVKKAEAEEMQSANAVMKIDQWGTDHSIIDNEWFLHTSPDYMQFEKGRYYVNENEFEKLYDPGKLIYIDHPFGKLQYFESNLLTKKD